MVACHFLNVKSMQKIPLKKLLEAMRKEGLPVLKGATKADAACCLGKHLFESGKVVRLTNTDVISLKNLKTV